MGTWKILSIKIHVWRVSDCIHSLKLKKFTSWYVKSRFSFIFQQANKIGIRTSKWTETKKRRDYSIVCLCTCAFRRQFEITANSEIVQMNANKKGKKEKKKNSAKYSVVFYEKFNIFLFRNCCLLDCFINFSTDYISLISTLKYTHTYCSFIP